MARSLQNTSRRQVHQGGYSLLEVIIAIGVAAVLAYAISQMLVNSGKQATSIASKGDFNSLTNQLQGAFNNANTCLAAISNAQPSGKLVLSRDAASTDYPMNLPISLGGTTYTAGSKFGGLNTPTSKKALTIQSLKLEGITSAGSTNTNQYIVSLNLAVDRSIAGETATGGNILTKSYKLIVTLDPKPVNPSAIPLKYAVLACAGQYSEYWVTTGDSGQDILYSGGRVGIGSCPSSLNCTDPPSVGATLDVVGSIQANTFMYRSDERLKEKIREIPGALDRVTKLRGVMFDWKDKSDPAASRDQLGFVAQEVERVFPEAVQTSAENGLKTVGYGNLLAPLVEAFKQQKQIIERQQREIEELKLTVARRKGKEN